MKYLGQLHYWLGIEIWREVGDALVKQQKYTRDLLKRLKMDRCMGISIP